MIRYDAVLFDFDGVLADSEPVHFGCWTEILAGFGIALDWETYARECIGVADREMLERLRRRANPPLDLEALLAEYPRKKGMFRDRMVVSPPFHAATLEMVRDVSRLLPLAVVSSSGREEVEPSLAAAGIHGCFQALVFGLEAGKLKPAPDPYLRAAELLGVKRPLVVEDSDAGETSGRAAGFEVLRVRSAAEVATRVREALGVA